MHGLNEYQQRLPVAIIEHVYALRKVAPWHRPSGLKLTPPEIWAIHTYLTVSGPFVAVGPSENRIMGMKVIQVIEPPSTLEDRFVYEDD